MERKKEENGLDDSEIDEEELQDKIISDNEFVEELNDEQYDEKNVEFNEVNDFEEDEIKKDFDQNLLEKINDENNENILNLDLENMKKGIVISHRQEFLDLFFDNSFYSTRILEVEKLAKIIKKESNHGLTGIKNLKNTAFINTIIQCLSHTLDFTYYILSKSYESEINKHSKSKGSIVEHLYTIISLLWSSNDKSISPTDFRYNLLTHLPKYTNSNTQYDANEFLMDLFELLEEELNQKKIKNFKQNNELKEILPKMCDESDIQASKRFWNHHLQSNKSIISDLFYGQFKSTTTCLVCNKSSISFEPFSTLTLEIPDLKRIDFLIVSNSLLKPVIKLTSFIPSNCLFVDLPKFTTEKYRKEKNSFFNSEKTKLKCLLVNTGTYSSRFVKLNDNIYQSSKKGNLIIFEVEQEDDEEDYYPYICMIKEELKPKKEEKEEENEENKEAEIIKQKEETKNKIENKVYAYNKKDSSVLFDEKKKKEKPKQIKEIDETNKNFSFPRLFYIPLGRKIRDLRIILFAFMSKFYPFEYEKINKNVKIPEYKSKILNKENIYSDPKVIKKTNEEKLLEFYEEEYKFIFEENFEALSNSNFIKNFPYKVKLVSARDEYKFKILFCNDPQEFNNQFEGEMTLQKFNQYIKQGYKLVIEILNNDSFAIIKNKMNEVISISPPSNDYVKPITLEDCLDNFILSEKLEKGNEWYCTSCKKYQNSMKRMELFYLHKNLIITLKRFETKMIGKTKIQIWKKNELVNYKVNGLKLDKYFFSNSYYKENNVTFDLFSVCQHSGSLEGGHYATACRNFGKWYEMDDTTVFQSDEDTIVSKEAYMLFYRRKEFK